MGLEKDWNFAVRWVLSVSKKKIKSHDGSFIDLQKDGQIWISNGKKNDSFSSCGWVVNRACNVYKILGLDIKYRKYFPVHKKILKFADKFKIRKLRLILTEEYKVKYGTKLVTKYGYINRSNFKRLLDKRRIIASNNGSVVLLKLSDAEWKDA